MCQLFVSFTFTIIIVTPYRIVNCFRNKELNKMHSNWRDCQEWHKQQLVFSTTSNEAAKLYDAALTQFVGWYDDNSLGGLEKTLEKLIEADPNFVMGHVINNAVQFIGTGCNPNIDLKFRLSLDNCYNLAFTADKDIWGRPFHAITLFSRNKAKWDMHGREKCSLWMSKACHLWEEILVTDPTDMLALKLAHDCYFYLGYQTEIRDSIARVLPSWRPGTPLRGYLMGMYSFGLCETGMYEAAEKYARKGLELNRNDAWSSHSLAHVFEMTGKQDDGINFLEATVKDWSDNNYLSCHLNWHNALYYIEKGNHEKAIDIYDQQIGSVASKTGIMLDIVDACSLLKRLELEGMKMGDRWKELHETCSPHKDDHLLAFNDVHFLMAYLGAGQREAAGKFLDSIKEFVGSGQGTNQEVTAKVGLALCESFAAYDDGDYATAVDLLWPVKHELVKIGGSNAQRDVFMQFLIDAALKSPRSLHTKLAKNLLVERKCLKENSPLTDRLMAKSLYEWTGID